MRRARQAAWIVLALGVLGLLVVGASTVARPTLVPTTTARPSPRALTPTQLRITPGAGLRAARPALCGLLATTAVQRETALTDRRSFGGYAAILLEYAQPASAALGSKGVAIPLSVAWFDTTGRFVTADYVAPCPPTGRACPIHVPGKASRLAVAVPRGTLAYFGIGSGTVVGLGGGCAA